MVQETENDELGADGENREEGSKGMQSSLIHHKDELAFKTELHSISAPH
jgi:hypothetical protein